MFQVDGILQAYYGVKNPFQVALLVGRFDIVDVCPEILDLAPGSIREAVEDVREVCFGGVMYNRDLPKSLKRKGQDRGFSEGYGFVSPFTALEWALKNPHAPGKYSVVTLFSIGKQLYCFCLSSVNGRRELSVRKQDPGRFWSGNVRFLAIPIQADV